MAIGLLEEAYLSGMVCMVAMDDAQFLPFHRHPQMSSIGTRNLGGCTVVIIASKHGAILAHISPHPGNNHQDLYAGERHVEKSMRRVMEMYNRSRAHFPPATGAWVVSPVYRGEVALPDQKRIAESLLQDMGLVSLSSILYVVGGSFNTGPGRATVFVDGRGLMPTVYVEDREVSQTFNAHLSLPTSLSFPSRQLWRPAYTTPPSSDLSSSSAEDSPHQESTLTKEPPQAAYSSQSARSTALYPVLPLSTSVAVTHPTSSIHPSSPPPSSSSQKQQPASSYIPCPTTPKSSKSPQPTPSTHLRPSSSSIGNPTPPPSTLQPPSTIAAPQALRIWKPPPKWDQQFRKSTASSSNDSASPAKKRKDVLSAEDAPRKRKGGAGVGDGLEHGSKKEI